MSIPADVNYINRVLNLNLETETEAVAGNTLRWDNERGWIMLYKSMIHYSLRNSLLEVLKFGLYMKSVGTSRWAEWEPRRNASY